MGPTSSKSDKSSSQYAFNLTLVAVAGQVGCLTLIIVLAALFGGLWLDNIFNTRPMITVLLMVASIPVTLVLMFLVVRSATSRLRSDKKTDTEKNPEEVQSGKNS